MANLKTMFFEHIANYLNHEDMDKMMANMKEEEFEEINKLLTDEKMFDSTANPYPKDEKATLLWELRQNRRDRCILSDIFRYLQGVP